MYGAKGRIGIIDISSCLSLAAELPQAIPPGVVAISSRLRLPGAEISVSALDAMLRSRDLEIAAQQLADAEVDLIMFACTSASFLHGRAWTEALMARITKATGVPASTTTTALVAALEELGVKRLAVGTPYPDEVNDLEQAFLEGLGLEVVRMKGLGLRTDHEIAALQRDAVERLALEVGQAPSDAVFLSCTNLPTLPLLQDLEERLQRPVISSNSVTIWDALRRLPASPAQPGLGSLLGRLAASPAH